MNHKTNIFAHRLNPWGVIGVWFRMRHADSLPSYALPLTFKQKLPEEDGHEVAPTLELDNDQAQQLMDALWSAGVRPTEGTGSAGALAAVERHLEDMRALVFKTKQPSTQKTP